MYENINIDIKRQRERLRKMTDEEFLLNGQLVQYLCSPKATLGRPLREIFLIQLAQVKAEWERRKKLKKDESQKVSNRTKDDRESRKYLRR